MTTIKTLVNECPNRVGFEEAATDYYAAKSKKRRLTANNIYQLIGQLISKYNMPFTVSDFLEAYK